MKNIKPIAIVIFCASLATVQAQELRTVTASSPLAVPANSVVQIWGVVTPTDGQSRASINLTFADGTVVSQALGELIPSSNNSETSNPIIGHTFAGVTRITLNTSYERNAAVTVKLLSQASEVVSTPMVLPAVNDLLYEITLETSVDITNWVPSYPGEFLGNGNHRFFRVKAIRKPVEAPAPQQVALPPPATQVPPTIPKAVPLQQAETSSRE